MSGYANDQPKAQKIASIDLYLLSLNILSIEFLPKALLFRKIHTSSLHAFSELAFNGNHTDNKMYRVYQYNSLPRVYSFRSSG